MYPLKGMLSLFPGSRGRGSGQGDLNMKPFPYKWELLPLGQPLTGKLNDSDSKYAPVERFSTATESFGGG